MNTMMESQNCPNAKYKGTVDNTVFQAHGHGESSTKSFKKYLEIYVLRRSISN